ncbi:MAG: Thiol-disulfide oxidoreductase ResA [Nitrospirae bacterium]|nr:Thiol-disulfide oxidoreductase ResA [Nitrospirota bacterium]
MGRLLHGCLQAEANPDAEREALMKRLLIVAAILLTPLWVAEVVLAAGFFKVGEKAPAFSLTSVTGDPLALESLKGKVVVLGLFHICDPCMVQGTNLQKVHEALSGKNVAVVGVNSSGNSKRDVGEFLSAFPVKVTYPYLLDPNKTTDKLYGGGKFIPNVYVIDQQGVIRWQRVGNMELAGAEVIIQEVDKLLASTPAQGAGAM